MEDSVVHWFRESQESCPLYCQWFNAWLWEISSFSVSASLSPKVSIMIFAYFVWDLKTLVYSKEKKNKQICCFLHSIKEEKSIFSAEHGCPLYEQNMSSRGIYRENFNRSNAPDCHLCLWKYPYFCVPALAMIIMASVGKASMLLEN